MQLLNGSALTSEQIHQLTTTHYDVAIIGAGCAGMAAATFSALEGKRVLLLESTAFVGGTSAWSAGTAWLPLSHHSTVNQAANQTADQTATSNDSAEKVHQYLDATVGTASEKTLRDAFIRHAANVVKLLETKTSLKFRAYAKHPDYFSDYPGATLSGRALEPEPFDGRLLGKYFGLLRPPIPEFTVLGGMMVDRTDIGHLLGLKQSLKSFIYSAKIIMRHAADRMRFSRGTRLVMGNALTGRLLHSMQQYDRIFLVNHAQLTELTQLTQRAQAKETQFAITLNTGNTNTVCTANRVIFASGGFNRHPQIRESLLNNAEMSWCVGAPGHTGTAHSLAVSLGGQFHQNKRTSAFWAPVSIRSRSDASHAVFPHFVLDRAKPGFITVNSAGKRFVNESTSYHLFALAMREQQCVPAFMIADHKAMFRYGMGMVRPGASGLTQAIADGYIVRANSWGELSAALDLPSCALESTIHQFNLYASSGHDTDWHRGETEYQKNIGDSSAGLPNPSLGALTQAPFYALRLYPGDIGASSGFRTNEKAQLLDHQNSPIPGLYAIGNDMQSIMGDVYPAPGITIGPGLVFAYIASTASSH